MAGDEDLSGPVQSLRENFRGNVFKVELVDDVIQVHVPKGSPLSLPKHYRGHDVKRVEIDKPLPKRADRSEPTEPTRQDIDQIGVLLASYDQRLGELEDRVRALEDGPPEAKIANQGKPPASKKT